MADDPCNASGFGQFLAGNYLLCRQRAGLIAQGQAEIQSVADNAAKYYGADSVTAQVTQVAADANKAAVPQDVDAITKDNASFCAGADLSLIGLGCITKFKFSLIIAGVVALFSLPYLLPFILRPRS